MVGGVSVNALAAVSICQQPVFVTLAASVGINVGITTIIARRKGEGKELDAKRTMKQAVYLSGLIGLILTIVSIVFAKPFFCKTYTFCKRIKPILYYKKITF